MTKTGTFDFRRRLARGRARGQGGEVLAHGGGIDIALQS